MLDKLIGSALQGLGQSQGNALLPVLASLLGNSGSTGGLSGLIQQFQQAGLGSQMSSWISTGQNLPVSADQLMQVFGRDQMQRMASDAGMDVQNLGTQLSQLLPQAVDQMTPNGEVPSGGLDDALGMLSRLMPR